MGSWGSHRLRGLIRASSMHSPRKEEQKRWFARRLHDPHAAISAVVGKGEPRRPKTSAFHALT